jgi:hypothetical protein
MMDAFLARYGNQDIHRLRGVEELSQSDKLIFRECLSELIKAEVQPLDGPSATGGG